MAQQNDGTSPKDMCRIWSRCSQRHIEFTGQNWMSRLALGYIEPSVDLMPLNKRFWSQFKLLQDCCYVAMRTSLSRRSQNKAMLTSALRIIQRCFARPQVKLRFHQLDTCLGECIQLGDTGPSTEISPLSSLLSLFLSLDNDIITRRFSWWWRDQRKDVAKVSLLEHACL